MNKLNNQYIEVCELPEGAGKTFIKMSALKIHESIDEHNDNGIHWDEQFIKDNLESIIGCPYVVSWFDEEEQIPSDHGEMSYDEDGNLIFDGVAVGTIVNAYIDNINVNDVDVKVLMTEGYLYSQRYNKFVKWLKEAVGKGKVYGSVEINGKGKSNIIEYLDGALNEDGTKKVPRTPKIYDFSALAILHNLVEPADKNSIVFEVNNKEGETKNMSKIEINELNHEDISILVENEFNKKFNEGKQYYTWFYPHKFYPTISTFIMKSWDKIGEYYKTTFTIEDGVLKISEIIKVEESWIPIGNEQSVEINTPLKQIIKGGKNDMNVEELNAKITELTAQNTELNTKITELNSAIGEKENKITEINEALTTANKSLEEVNAKCSAIEVECNGYKEEKAKLDAEKKQAEVNTYFENEIPKNGFEETEINTLKEFVEKCDLEGLKNAESNLIVKKFKELKNNSSVETNTTSEVFFKTKEEKVDDIEAGKALFN